MQCVTFYCPNIAIDMSDRYIQVVLQSLTPLTPHLNSGTDVSIRQVESGSLLIVYKYSIHQCVLQEKNMISQQYSSYKYYIASCSGIYIRVYVCIHTHVQPSHLHDMYLSLQNHVATQTGDAELLCSFASTFKYCTDWGGSMHR